MYLHSIILLLSHMDLYCFLEFSLILLLLFYRPSTGHFNRWYRFNDTTVEEFEMTSESLETECFGGSYKVARQDKSRSKLYAF